MILDNKLTKVTFKKVITIITYKLEQKKSNF